jgi:hypothetical protein
MIHAGVHEETEDKFVSFMLDKDWYHGYHVSWTP